MLGRWLNKIPLLQRREAVQAEFPPNDVEPRFRIKASISSLKRGEHGIGALEGFDKEKSIKVLWSGPLNFSTSDDDSMQKYSEGYEDGVGLLLTAEDNNGRPISLLSHQMIPRFDYDNPNLSSQKNYIQTSVQAFVSKAKPGTIDAGFFGCLASTEEQFNDYVGTISSTAKIVRPVLRFDPVIVAAPTIGNEYGTSAAVDHQKKQRWMVRRKSQALELSEPLASSKVVEMIHVLSSFWRSQ